MTVSGWDEDGAHSLFDRVGPEWGRSRMLTEAQTRRNTVPVSFECREKNRNRLFLIFSSQYSEGYVVFHVVG